MEERNEIKRQADKFRQEKNWQKAAELYEKIVQNKQDSLWDNYFYALCLKNMKRFDESLQICRKVYSLSSKFKPNNNLYAQNIYSITQQRLANTEVRQITKALTAVYKLLEHNYEYFSFHKAYFYLMKKLEDLKRFNDIVLICKEFEPNEIDFEISEKKEGYPSFGEYFYVVQVKAYFNLKNYKKVVELTDVALKKIKKFHFDYDVWIRRLKAKSQAYLNLPDDALKEYFFILKRKKDWFIYFEIAQILHKSGRKPETEFFLAKALTDKQKPEYKIKLYSFAMKTDLKCVEKQDLNRILCQLKPQFAQKPCDNDNRKAIDLNKKIITKAEKFLKNQRKKGKVIKNFSKKTGLIQQNKRTIFCISEKKTLILKAGQVVEYYEGYNYDFKRNEIKKCAYVEKILEE